jgi:PrtD family type I secretion system ABC transporter
MIQKTQHLAQSFYRWFSTCIEKAANSFSSIGQEELAYDDSATSLEQVKRTLSASKLSLWYAFFLSGVSNLLMLAVPLYSLQVLDRVVSSGSIETLLMLTLITIAAIAFLNIIQSIRGFLFSCLTRWFHDKLSSVLFIHGITQSACVRQAKNNQSLQDLNTIRSFFSANMIGAILDLPWSIIFLAALFFMHPVIGMVTVIGGILLLILGIINDAMTSSIINAANHHQIHSQHYADAANRNAEVIEGMGMLSHITTKWHKISQKAAILQEDANTRSNILNYLSRFIRLLLQISATGIGGYLVLHNEMTVGAMIASGILAGRALAPFETAIVSWKGFVSFRTSLSHLLESIEKDVSRHKNMALPAPKGALNLEAVYYTPKSSKLPIIKKIDLNIPSGNIVGIMGPSAAGKSTLAKLIVGIWKPTSGHVRLDSIDVFSWNRDDFGQYVGYLPQEVELFDGTVMDNIARMEETKDTKKAIAAAQFAGVHEMIQQLPKGYETPIGLEGVLLSAGQRQRIGLARAFYNNPKLVVLDEPNANLDYEGEVALEQCLKNAKKAEMTVITISHRRSIIASIDRLMVMKDGQVVIYDERDKALKKLQGPQKKQKTKNR